MSPEFGFCEFNYKRPESRIISAEERRSSVYEEDCGPEGKFFQPNLAAYQEEIAELQERIKKLRESK